MKKFKLTNNKKEWFGKTLYQIESLINFGNIHVGDKGGWIEKEENLAQDGNAWVYGDARVSGDAEVSGNASIIWISKIGSRYGTTTVFKNKDGGLNVVCGCFFGTLEEFTKKVEATHGDSKYGREYKVLIDLIKVHFEVQDE